MTRHQGARRYLLPLTPLFRAAIALREVRLRSGFEPGPARTNPLTPLEFARNVARMHCDSVVLARSLQ